MITASELDVLGVVLDRLKGGQRTVLIEWAELQLQFEDGETVSDVIHKLSIRGMVDFVPPLIEGTPGLVSRRAPELPDLARAPGSSRTRVPLGR
jgi:hypothetical protein